MSTRTFDSVKTSFVLSNSNQAFRLAATQDTMIKVDLAGNIDLSNDSVLVRIDTLLPATIGLMHIILISC